MAAELSATAWASLVGFIIAVVLIIVSPSFKACGRKWTLDFSSGPLLVVSILLITTLAPLSALHAGIVGDATLQPYAIVILFFSLAYVAISLDCTGCFEAAALWAAARAGTSSVRLFTAFYMLASVMTVVTSNDIVILTLTPILALAARHTGAPAFPFLVGIFLPANTLSIALLIGNPTNLIIGGALGIDFFTYMRWMIAPAIVAALAGYAGLRVYYRKELATPLATAAALGSPSSAIRDRSGAIFGGVVLAGVLLLLSVAPYIGLSMSAITAGGAVISILRDGFADIRRKGGSAASGAAEGASGRGGLAGEDANAIVSANAHVATGGKDGSWSEGAAGMPAAALPVASAAATLPTAASPRNTDPVAHGAGEPAVPSVAVPVAVSAAAPGAAPVAASLASEQQQQPQQQSSLAWEVWRRLPFHSSIESAAAHIPTVMRVLGRMPWGLLPFVIAMFTLTSALAEDGWVRLLAGWLAPIAAEGGPVGASLAFLFLSSIACNLMNNQPMAVLFSRVLQDSAFASVPPASFSAAAYATIAGSNLGANVTLIGALAGIMWATQARDKGVPVTYWAFARVAAIVTVPVIVITALIIGLEFR